MRKDAEIDRIEAIERKVRQSELQRLKGELGEAKQQLRQSRNEVRCAQDEGLEARPNSVSRKDRLDSCPG